MSVFFSFCRLVALALILSSCSGSNPQINDSLLDRIIEHGKIRVGTTADYKPFSYIMEGSNSDIIGLDIDLAQHLADSLGVELVLVKTSWPSLITDLQADRYDIGMSGITITLSRQKRAFFSDPMMVSGKVAISHSKNVSRFQSIEDINSEGTRVIFNPGGTNEVFARKHFPNATLIENGENLTVFEKVRTGEADIMVTDAIEAIVQAKIIPELEAINPEKPLNTFKIAYLMPKDIVFKSYVDQWLDKIKEDGTFDVLYRQALTKLTAQK